MADHTFVILKYTDKIPSMASCTKCQRKFFVPTSLGSDPGLAEQYLLEKFARHTCPNETEDWRTRM